MRQKKLAKVLNVSVNTIQRWRREGLRYSQATPAAIEIEMSDLKAFLIKRGGKYLDWARELERKKVL